MSWQIPLCWSASAELSGENRKEVNVSAVMMRFVLVPADVDGEGEEGSEDDNAGERTSFGMTE
jgi:hypothetical protein